MSSGGPVPPNAHAAARASFAAYRLGLLDAERAQALREHLRGCDSCRAAFEPFLERTSDEEDRRGHVPLALLARSGAATAALSPGERELIDEHVRSCDRCADTRAFALGLYDVRPAARRPWRWRFALGTGAAIAAVLALVLVRDTVPPRPAPPTSTAPATPPAVAPPAVARGPVRTAPVVTLGTTRAAGGQVVRVASGTIALPLRVPPLLGVGPEARIRISVTGPHGLDAGSVELPHRALFGEDASPALEARAPSGTELPAGKYGVQEVSDLPDPATPGGFVQAEYGFTLEIGR